MYKSRRQYGEWPIAGCVPAFPLPAAPAPRSAYKFAVSHVGLCECVDETGVFKDMKLLYNNKMDINIEL